LRLRRQICLAGVSMGLAIQIKWIAGLGLARMNMILNDFPTANVMELNTFANGIIIRIIFKNEFFYFNLVK